MGLFSFLFGGASKAGTTPETAIVVNSIAEEYDWMARNCPGFQPSTQSLQHINGKPYDVLTWRSLRGEERTVYFDISRFYGRL